MHFAQEPRAKGARVEGYFSGENYPVCPISSEPRRPTGAGGGQDPSEGGRERMDGPKGSVTECVPSAELPCMPQPPSTTQQHPAAGHRHTVGKN